MEYKEGIRVIRPASVEEWRKWLENNGSIEKAVWLIIYKVKSSVPGIRWHDAIEHALCYGWVDSKAAGRDPLSCYLKFTPRSPSSRWGKRNIERVKKLTAQGWMTPAGQTLVDLAKQGGRWEE